MPSSIDSAFRSLTDQLSIVVLSAVSEQIRIVVEAEFQRVQGRSRAVPQAVAASEGFRLLYDKKAAAQALSVSVRTIETLLARKALRYQRCGNRVLIPASELRRITKLNQMMPSKD